MKAKISSFGIFLAGVACWAIGWGGCSTSQVAPLPELPPTPPDYVKVPHPEGLDIGDLVAIFTDSSAPSPDTLKTCDADFAKLRTMTNSTDELSQGAREFVRIEPVKYHWCFYGKLYQLEEQLAQDAYIDEKQKHVLDAYIFLTPISRAFMAEYKDSRYLRWAAFRYRSLSEHVFYRKMDFTETANRELAGPVNPWGLVRPGDDTRYGVLEKYGLIKPVDSAPVAEGPVTEEYAPSEPGFESRTPASSATEVEKTVDKPNSNSGAQKEPSKWIEQVPSGKSAAEALIQGDNLTPVN